MSTQNCRRCNQAFEFNPAYPHALWYCSRDCYHEHRREQKAEFVKTGKPCDICGKLFYPNPKKSQADFEKRQSCGRQCGAQKRRNTIQDLLRRIVVNQKTGCHIWTGPKNWTGYGQVRFNNRLTMAHRVIWEHYRGPIPEGLQIDHICMVRACCNVEHLRTVTARENCLANTCNSMGAQNSRKTECPTCGGPFTIRPNGYRWCEPCNRRNQTEYQRKYRSRPEWNAVNTANVRKYRAKKKEEGDLNG